MSFSDPYKSSDDGLTWIYVFILLCCGVFYVARASGSEATATQEAKAFAAEFDLDPKHVKCQAIDSDGDGYVSCTALDKDGRPFPIECAAALTFWNDSCRVATGKNRGWRGR